MITTLESQRVDCTSYSPRYVTVMAAGVAIVIFLYYWTLLSDGKFLGVATMRYALVFNSMIEHMARGAFDVDPAIILKEGFTRDGRTYAYFGVLPAVLRLPVLLLPRYRDVDFTVVSCAIAATIVALAKLAAVVRAGRMAQAIGLNRYFPVLMGLVVIFGGAQVQFLRPSVYQESIFWAAAFTALFVIQAFRWCVDVAGRRSAHLVWVAALAGLCLNTRVSTSLGLYAACGGLILAQTPVILGSRGGPQGRAILGRMAAPALVLLCFVLICGFINYQRWGNPLTFQDYRYYNTITTDDPVHEVIRQHGFFSLERIPFALSYYFLQIWAIIRPDEEFLSHETRERLFFLVEPPPATFLLSDPFILTSSLFGLVLLCRRAGNGFDGLAARITAICLLIPGVLMLMAIAVSFRYRMEFYPGFEFLALFGLVSLGRNASPRAHLLVRAGFAAAALSAVVAHVDLLAYKITPWGDYLPVEKTGWIASYRNYLELNYPQLGSLMRGR